MQCAANALPTIVVRSARCAQVHFGAYAASLPTPHHPPHIPPHTVTFLLFILDSPLPSTTFCTDTVSPSPHMLTYTTCSHAHLHTGTPSKCGRDISLVIDNFVYIWNCPFGAISLLHTLFVPDPPVLWGATGHGFYPRLCPMVALFHCRCRCRFLGITWSCCGTQPLDT